MHVQTHACIYTHACTHTRTYTHAHVHARAHIHTHAHRHTHTTRTHTPLTRPLSWRVPLDYNTIANSLFSLASLTIATNLYQDELHL